MKQTYRILIVDDGDRFCSALQSELNNLAFSRDYDLKIERASTPEEAKESLYTHEYDLISLDIAFNTQRVAQSFDSDYIHSRYYGRYLYETEIRGRIDPEQTRIIVVSNSEEDAMEREFDYNRSLTYFCKKTSTEKQIAAHIISYFDTNRQSFYNSAFIVYGHNRVMRKNVESYLRANNISIVDLNTGPTSGLKSFVDSLTESAHQAQCAIILLSKDDICLDTNELQLRYRARQNVIFEMGLFIGVLGKRKLIILHEKCARFEFPSDIQGAYYICYDDLDSIRWKNELASALKKVGFRHIDNTGYKNESIREEELLREFAKSEHSTEDILCYLKSKSQVK